MKLLSCFPNTLLVTLLICRQLSKPLAVLVYIRLQIQLVPHILKIPNDIWTYEIVLLSIIFK